MQNSENQEQKLSHKQWRNQLKKQRRKEKRQQAAILQDVEQQKRQDEREQSAEYLRWLLEQEMAEKRQQQAEGKQQEFLHMLWCRREAQAQEWFRLGKLRVEEEKQRKLQEEQRIREEWEERQRIEKENEERRAKEEEERKEKQAKLLKQATANEKTGEEAWHNPIAPPRAEKIRDTCPFFAKVAACRFGERCSRVHPEPEATSTLLFPGMYQNFKLEQRDRDEYDTDLGLEFDDGEVYQDFLDFYHDVLPELRNSGRVVQFKVCCNSEPHLRGNVYVQYSRESEAEKAMVTLNSRWYGGRQISCQPAVIEKWSNAICGLHFIKKCPKGRQCNFLHVFRNPGNEFRDADRDRSPRGQRSRSYREGSRYSHRGHGSVRYRRSRSRSPSRRRSRSKSPARRRSRSPGGRRSRSNSRGHHRSRSPSRQRSRTRSPRRRKSGLSNRRRSRSSTPRGSRSVSHQRSRSRSPRYRKSKKSRISHSRSPDRKSISSKKSTRRKWDRRSKSKSPEHRKRQRSKSRSRSMSPYFKKLYQSGSEISSTGNLHVTRSNDVGDTPGDAADKTTSSDVTLRHIEDIHDVVKPDTNCTFENSDNGQSCDVTSPVGPMTRCVRDTSERSDVVLRQDSLGDRLSHHGDSSVIHTDQREPNHSGQREPNHSDQREPNHSDQREPNHSDQREPNHSDQREPNHSDQREPNRSDQREPNHSDQREPNNSRTLTTGTLTEKCDDQLGEGSQGLADDVTNGDTGCDMVQTNNTSIVEQTSEDLGQSTSTKKHKHKKKKKKHKKSENRSESQSPSGHHKKHKKHRHRDKDNVDHPREPPDGGVDSIPLPM